MMEWKQTVNQNVLLKRKLKESRPVEAGMDQTTSQHQCNRSLLAARFGLISTHISSLWINEFWYFTEGNHLELCYNTWLYLDSHEAKWTATNRSKMYLFLAVIMLMTMTRKNKTHEIVQLIHWFPRPYWTNYLPEVDLWRFWGTYIPTIFQRKLMKTSCIRSSQ